MSLGWLHIAAGLPDDELSRWGATRNGANRELAKMAEGMAD